MAIIGTITPEAIKPIATNHQEVPEFKPRNGGNIKLPAPKNIENRAKPAIIDFLFSFMIAEFKLPGKI
jgi:hypothetical protein